MDDQISDKLNDFFKTYKTISYKKGEILIRAGDNPSGIFYLKTGRVKKYAISKKGDELVVNIFKPSSFFPMSHAINNHANDYYYEAMENLELVKAPISDTVIFVKKNPDIMYNLLSRVFLGSEGLLSRMTYLMAGNAYSRLIAELLIIAKRFGTYNENEVIIKTTEKDLATQVGMTRETVNREMKILKERKLITFKNGLLTIMNMHDLESELIKS